MVQEREAVGGVYVQLRDGTLHFRKTVRGRALAWSGLRRLYRAVDVRRVLVAVGSRWFVIRRGGSWREVFGVFSVGAAVSIIVRGG